MLNQQQRFNILQKHAKNFVADSRSVNPLLKGVHFAENGLAFITDTYKAVIVKDVHNYTTSCTFHYKTGEKLNGDYPNIPNLIAKGFKTKINFCFDIAYPKLLKTHKAADIISGIAETDKKLSCKYHVGAGHLLLTAGRETCNCASLLASNPKTGNIFEVAFKANYVIAALQMLADFKPRKLIFGFNEQFTPFALISDVGVEIVISPCKY